MTNTNRKAAIKAVKEATESAVQMYGHDFTGALETALRETASEFGVEQAEIEQAVNANWPWIGTIG